VRVGYVDVPPLAWNEGDPERPKGIGVDALTHVARARGWVLRFQLVSLENALANLADCRLDVAIAPKLPARLRRAHLEVLDRSVPYFQSVSAITVAARAQAGEADGLAPVDAPGGGVLHAAIDGALEALVFGSLGVAALVLLVAIANLRLPWRRGRLWPETLRPVLLDPAAKGGLPAVRWLWSSRVGRVLLGAWFAAGAAGALVRFPPPGLKESRGRRTHLAALREALAGVDAIGMRPGGSTVPCPDLTRCLHDLSRGQLAALAANVDEVCHHVRRERLDGVRFLAGALWPREHVYLLPRESGLRRRLDESLLTAQMDSRSEWRALAEKYHTPWDPPTLAAGCAPPPEAR
jgi:ABC-type amino acid transport substrate-binding protein